MTIASTQHPLIFAGLDLELLSEPCLLCSEAHELHGNDQSDAVKESLWQYCEIFQETRNKAGNETPGKATLP